MSRIDDVVEFLRKERLLHDPTDWPNSPLPLPEVNEDRDEIRKVDHRRLVRTRTPSISAGDSWTDGDILGGLGSGVEVDGAREFGELTASREGGGYQPTPVWEAFAWYAPIHLHRQEWGLFIREDVIPIIASQIAHFVPATAANGRLVSRLRLAAYYSLFLHESFHHQVESFAIRLNLARRDRPGIWRRYEDAVYRPSLFTPDNLEEALANAVVVRRMGSFKQQLGTDVVDAVARWVRVRAEFVDPPGYAECRHYLTARRFNDGVRRLQSQIHDAALMPQVSDDDWRVAPELFRRLFDPAENVYTVTGLGAQSQFPTGPAFVVPVRKTRKFLRENGFVHQPDRGKGDHEVWKRPDGKEVTLDGTAKDLSNRIEQTTAATLGLSRRELREAIRDGRRVV